MNSRFVLLSLVFATTGSHGCAPDWSKEPSVDAAIGDAAHRQEDRDAASTQPVADAGGKDRAESGAAGDSGTVKAGDGASTSSTCVAGTEVCDGQDNDCDGIVDNGVLKNECGGCDSIVPAHAKGMQCRNGGQGACDLPGTYACLGGTTVCNAPPPPASSEVCAGVVLDLSFDSLYVDTTQDRSRFGAVGVLHGGTTMASSPHGGALMFDGKESYVGVAYGSQFANLNSYSVTAWVKLPELTGSYTILSTRNGGDTFDFKVFRNLVYGDIGEGSRFITGFMLGATDTGSNGQSGVLEANTWYHLAVTVDNSAKAFSVYVNGDLKRSYPIPASSLPLFMNPNSILTVGAGNTGVSENLSGLLDEVMVFSRPLTAPEIANLAAH
ncbi:MAG: hypothetical protein JWN48_2999 [Myxococcaceae bacterium]|nr:hypothetical protein [Myxococcaceae bacterium]